MLLIVLFFKTCNMKLSDRQCGIAMQFSEPFDNIESKRPYRKHNDRNAVVNVFYKSLLKVV